MGVVFLCLVIRKEVVLQFLPNFIANRILNEIIYEKFHFCSIFKFFIDL
jgi:hypothetical protein